MPKLTLEQKMHRPIQAEVKVLDRAFGGMEAGQLMLISTPRDIEAAIQLIPEKSFISVSQLRRQLSIAKGADGTCPLTTGIFLRIVAEYAFECYLNGKEVRDLPPVWRVIDITSPLAKKLPLGLLVLIREQQSREGLHVQ
jgi:hypothetical protein